MAQELVEKRLPDDIDKKMPAQISIKRTVDNEEKVFNIPLVKAFYVKGPFRGYPYLHPRVTIEDLESLMEAYGAEDFVDLIRKAFQAIGRAALEFASEGHREVKVDADGVKIGSINFVDQAKWLQALETGEYRGEKISELQEKVEAKQMEVSVLAKQLIKTLPDGTRTPDMNVSLQIMKLSDVIAKLNEQINNKRRKGKDTMEEEEEATPAPA
jgi:hypothetical protein